MYTDFCLIMYIKLLMRYSLGRCPVDGWGFPSTGEKEVINYCQASKSWNFTNIEDCICKSYPAL